MLHIHQNIGKGCMCLPNRMAYLSQAIFATNFATSFVRSFLSIFKRKYTSSSQLFNNDLAKSSFLAFEVFFQGSNSVIYLDSVVFKSLLILSVTFDNILNCFTKLHPYTACQVSWHNKPIFHVVILMYKI